MKLPLTPSLAYFSRKKNFGGSGGGGWISTGDMFPGLFEPIDRCIPPDAFALLDRVPPKRLPL